jgi:hypothetical protein
LNVEPVRQAQGKLGTLKPASALNGAKWSEETLAYTLSGARANKRFLTPFFQQKHPSKIPLSDPGHTDKLLSGFILYPFAFIL